MNENVDQMLNIKGYWKDITGLCILLGLVVMFYYPETNPLHSRYVYYADSFERAATHINPDYTTFFRRYNWETHSPLHTLLARYSLHIFRNNLANAVTLLHLGSALVAAILIFITNRYYFSVLSSLFMSLFLILGRTIMPITRLRGAINGPLLIPFVLIFVYNLAKTQDRTQHWKQQLIPMTFVAISIAVMYCLGGHEMIYSLAFLIGFVALLVLEWIVRCTREKRFLQGLTYFSAASLAVGVVFILVLFAWVSFGIDNQQQPVSFYDAVTYNGFYKENTSFRRAALSDAVKEPKLAQKNRLLLLQSTFIEGRYLTKYGIEHKDTFLYPGKGFNGIIPLFMFPGLLIGIVYLTKDFVLLFKSRPGKETLRPKKYFVMLNVALLGMFFGTMIISGDPKPTRYSLSIYTIYALSIMGYIGLLQAIKDRVNRRSFQYMAVGGIMLFISAATAMQLFKNYRDLQISVSNHRKNPTIFIAQVIAEACSKYASKTVFIALPNVHFPAVGMLLGFKLPKNVRLSSFENWKDWNNQSNKPKLPPNSVFYIWNKDLKIFNVHYSK